MVPVPVTMLTAMAPEVPAIDDVAVSVAVMALLPNARSVAEKIKAARRLSQERAALRRRGQRWQRWFENAAVAESSAEWVERNLGCSSG